MRKWICAVLALCLAAALCGCGDETKMKTDRKRAGEVLVESDTGPGGDAEPSEVDELGPAREASDEPQSPAEDVTLAEPSEEADKAPGELADAEFSNPLVAAELTDDHAMVWNDAALEAAMRRVTGIASGDIMLSDLWDRIELDLSGWDIRDISALSELTNLLWLDLRDNEITDISALSTLTYLSSLDISDNEIRDLAPLAELPYVTELSAADNEVTDIGPLAAMQYLSWLDLSDNEIRDISALAGLTGLTDLDLSDNPVSDVSPLAELEYLCFLDLSDTNVRDVTALTALTSLESIDLTETAADASVLRQANEWLEILTG